MGYGQDGPYRAFPAGADFSTPSGGASAGQWRAMVLDSTGQLQLNVTAGGRIFGILQDDPAAGSAGTVKVRDASKAFAGGTFAIGAQLASDAVGKLVEAATDDHVIAIALQAGAAGRKVAVELGYFGVAE